MKITQDGKPKFLPITIILETEEEARTLLGISGAQITGSVGEMGAAEADKINGVFYTKLYDLMWRA